MTLPGLHEDLERLLRAYQVTPARQLLRALLCGPSEWGYSGAVDLSDVGVGKSYMDAAAALSTGRRPIVLCPVVGKEGWARTFKALGREPLFIGSYEAVRGGWRSDVATLEGRFFKWKNTRDAIIIMDEAQKVKGDQSMTTALLGGAIMAQIPIIAASATMGCSPVDLRIAGRVTGLHNGGADWRRFLLENGCWLDEEENPPRWKFNPRFSHVLDDINNILIPQRGCRVRKADMGEQPGTTITPLEIDAKEAPALLEEWKELQDKLRGMRANPDRFNADVIRGVKRAAEIRLWKKYEMAMVKPVAARVKACLDEGKSVVVFFSFTPSRVAMGKILKTKDGFFGGQSKNQRARIEAEFQANRIHVLLCNIKAASSSVSLHDLTGERPRETFIFPSNNPDAMGQAPGRVDRQGGQTHSQQWIPYIPSPFMNNLLKMSMAKQKRMETLNNGGPQQRFHRRLAA